MQHLQANTGTNEIAFGRNRGQDAEVRKKRNTPIQHHTFKYDAHLHAYTDGTDKVMVTWNCCIG